MLDSKGARMYQIQVPFEPRPISDQLLTAVLDSIYRFTARPNVELRRVDLRRALHIPRFSPPVTDVIVGEDGRTWLRRATGLGDTVTYTVVEPNGRVLGDVQLVRGGTVAAATSSRILVIEDQASDHPRLVGYRLVEERRRRAASPK